MALPTRPVPTRIHGDYSFVYAKGTGDADYVLCAQVTEATGGQEESMDEWRTVGSGIQRASQETEYPVSLNILTPTDITEAARLVGIHEPGAGPFAWVGTESIVVNPTIDIDFKIEDYTRAGVLLQTEFWDNVNWEKLETKTTATGYKTWTLTGAADEVYTTPPAG